MALLGSPTEHELKDAVVRMREKGLRATGCNSAIRAINAYLHWSTAGTEVKCSPRADISAFHSSKSHSLSCPRSPPLR
jgi:hypothetical protein